MPQAFCRFTEVIDFMAQSVAQVPDLRCVGRSGTRPTVLGVADFCPADRGRIDITCAKCLTSGLPRKACGIRHECLRYVFLLLAVAGALWAAQPAWLDFVN